KSSIASRVPGIEAPERAGGSRREKRREYRTGHGEGAADPVLRAIRDFSMLGPSGSLRGLVMLSYAGRSALVGSLPVFDSMRRAQGMGFHRVNTGIRPVAFPEHSAIKYRADPGS